MAVADTIIIDNGVIFEFISCEAVSGGDRTTFCDVTPVAVPVPPPLRPNPPAGFNISGFSIAENASEPIIVNYDYTAAALPPGETGSIDGLVIYGLRTFWNAGADADDVVSLDTTVSVGGNPVAQFGLTGTSPTANIIFDQAYGSAEGLRFENTLTAQGDNVTLSAINAIFKTAGIDLEKLTNGEDADDPTGPLLDVGSIATFTYLVTNTGDSDLSNVVVIDDAGTPGDTSDDFTPAFVGGDTDNDNILDLDEVWEYQAARIVTAGQYTNIATVTANPVDPDGGDVPDTVIVTDADPSNHFGVLPEIELKKFVRIEQADGTAGPDFDANEPPFPEGTIDEDTAVFTYLVSNPGSTALDLRDGQGGFRLIDDNATPADSSDDFTPTFVGGDTDGDSLLDINEVWEFTASEPVVGDDTTDAGEAVQRTNTAEVTGTPVDDAGNPLGLADVEDDDPATYVAVPGIVVEDVASLGDVVFFDDNANGIQEAGEAGADGVTVILTGGGADGVIGTSDDTTATTTTDAAGKYRFDGLNPGEEYKVTFDPTSLPAGFVFTRQNAGSNDALDSDASPLTGMTQIVTLAPGEFNDTLDAGLHECIVYLDFETDAEGNALRAGDLVGRAFGDFGITISTVGGFGPMIFDSRKPTGGDSDLGTANSDFGGPGVGSGGEAGTLGENDVELGNVLIISEDGNSSDPDDKGNGGTIVLEFSTLYSVGFLDILDQEEGGEVRTYDPFGNLTSTTPLARLGDNSYQRAFISETNVGRMEVEFFGSGALDHICLAPLPVAALGDLVFEDRNADGLQDDGEAGIAGATVKLLDPDGTVLDTTTTDADGFYLFDNLPPGDYQVMFVTPDGFDGVSPAGQGSDPNLDSNGPMSGVVTLEAGEVDRSIDAGFFKLAGLGDFVFADVDQDGLQGPGEAGIAGATVKLLSAGGDELATTTTNADGFYSFTGLTPGDYKVMFVQPDGFDGISPVNAGDDTRDSDADPATLMTGIISLGSGEFNPTIDAGFFQTAGPVCEIFLDFEADAGGNPLVAGDVINTAFNGVGVTISAFFPNGNAALPMIFDTNNPTGGDTDLASTERNNVLIISEDGDSNDPDDNGNGGTVVLDFNAPLTVSELVIQDLERDQTDAIRAYDADGNLIKSLSLAGLGDGSEQTVVIDASNVSQLVIESDTSFAIDDICLTETITAVDIEKFVKAVAAVCMPEEVHIAYDFEGGPQGFAYADDLFRKTSKPYYASGDHGDYGTDGSEGLSVYLGGKNNHDIYGMSGGWTRTLVLEQAADVEISFDYRIWSDHSIDHGEWVEALFSVNSELIGDNGKDYLARVEGGGDIEYRTFSETVSLEAGTHEIALGGSFNRKTTASEVGILKFDNLAINYSTCTGPVACETVSLDYTFDHDAETFHYIDDAFLATHEPHYAHGFYSDSLEALVVELGGVDNHDIHDMSGAWQQTLTLDQATEVAVSFDYKLWQDHEFEDDESVEALFAVNGGLVGDGGDRYLAKLSGGGDTGWQTFTTTLSLDAGETLFDFGGYLDQKTYSNETAYVKFDNIRFEYADCSTAGVCETVTVGYTFDADDEGFHYIDDAFLATHEPHYAHGFYSDSLEALVVELGGVDNHDIHDMSGAWQQTLTLDQATEVAVSFDYKLWQDHEFEDDESVEALFAVNGGLVGDGGDRYLAKLSGGGDTGWQTFTTTLSLDAGETLFDFGGYLDQKTYSNETAYVKFDNIRFEYAVCTDGHPGDLGADADTPAKALEVTEGDELVFSYVVTNTGHETLSGVAVDDDVLTGSVEAIVDVAGFNVGDANANNWLEPGEEWLYSATGTAGLGLNTNIGSVTATGILSGMSVTDEDAAVYDGLLA